MTGKRSPSLLGTSGVAALLGVHPKHVFRLLKRGLPGHRLGGEWRFDADEIMAWLRKDTATAEASSAGGERRVGPPPPLLAANGDVCVELLLGALARSQPTPFGLVQADTTSGRGYVARGSVLAAGVHGGETQASEALLKVILTRRRICVAFPKAKRLRSLRGLAGLRLASRPATAGVRAHLERALAESGVDSAELHEQALVCASHRDVALSVLSGQAEAGVLTVAWAERAGLGSLPIAEEDYALGLRADALEHELGRVLVRTLQSSELRRALSRSAGYEPRAAGTLL